MSPFLMIYVFSYGLDTFNLKIDLHFITYNNTMQPFKTKKQRTQYNVELYKVYRLN